jgi:protein SCO1/2
MWNAGEFTAKRFPNVVLRTHDDRTVRFYDDVVKDKLVIITFMFTSCTSQCPRNTANLAKLQDALGNRFGRDVFLISISVDPERDTPAALKAYAARFGAKPGWTFLTGRIDDIDAIQRALGVYDRRDPAPHTGMAIYGNDALGQWAATPIMQNADSLARIVLRLASPR